MLQKNGLLLRDKYEPLKIQGESHGDLHFLSAHVQDALIPVTGLRFHQEKGRFHLDLNRFRWEIEEEEDEGAPLFYRTHSGLSFGHIKSVRHRGFHPSHPTHVLYLLAIRSQKEGGILIHCSDGSSISLEAEKIFCRLSDRGEHWPTSIKPEHA